MRRLVLVLPLLLAACASTRDIPVAARDDICAIMDTNSHWRKDLIKTRERWGAPPHVVVAIMRQESNFDAKARPPRADGFLFFPGKRPSSAYGYAQALDSTWETYQRATGNPRADRNDFDDAVDFIGWYLSESKRRNGVALTDARNQYFNYHEGWGGYAKRTHQSKSWLIGVADRVATRAANYERQLYNCPLERKRLFGIF